ncbi:carotenoid oxygenase family protein [Alloacidobacterium sp.]|uniref:carotenoid oxygenase family protein n=1 Tax=Alloacidobacterium sp. TaxID=2951999 RepID=UPI0039C87AA0
MQPWTSNNPALSGAFEPVFDERDDTDLKVEGEIPRSLRGVFMRNGPNPQYKPDDHYAYPFDGTGMVHAIYIENGRARYRNRWVMTKEMQQERAAGHVSFPASMMRISVARRAAVMWDCAILAQVKSRRSARLKPWPAII